MSLLVLMCVGLGPLGAAHAADAECKKMILTGNSGYPPISWRDRARPNEILSVAGELVQMAMKEKGVAVELRYVGPWKRAQLAIKTGEADAIHSAYINEERKQYMDYTAVPFIMDPTVVFVKKGKPIPFKQKEDLVGLSGASPIGESYGDEFDNFAKAKLKIDLTTSVEVALKKLLADRVQYVVHGMYPGLAAAESAGILDQIEYMPTPVITAGMYVAFSKKSPCSAKYRDYLSAKIAEYVKQGETERLVKKYTAIWKEQTKLKPVEN
jgi:polar amino acid transport system substrate-binding protein